MLIPSNLSNGIMGVPSLSRRVNANSQLMSPVVIRFIKLIKKGEC